MKVEANVEKKEEYIEELAKTYSKDQSFEVDSEALLTLKDCSATENEVVVGNFCDETILLAEQNIEKEEKIFEGDIRYSNGIYSFPFESPKEKKGSMTFEKSSDAILELNEDNVVQKVQVMRDNYEQLFSFSKQDDIVERISSFTITAYEDGNRMSTYSTITACEEDDKMSMSSSTITAFSSQIIFDKKIDEEFIKTNQVVVKYVEVNEIVKKIIEQNPQIPACEEDDGTSTSSSTITTDCSQYVSDDEINEKCIENEQTKENIIKREIIDGNRIVDLKYLINSLLNLAYDEDDQHKVSCTQRKWEIRKSSEKGFKTFVTLFCKGCRTTVIQKSHPNDPKKNGY